MKKKYLTYAGIAAAAILVVIFASILLTGSFSVFSTATIDAIPDHAAGDLVVFTGTTNLDAGTRLELDIVNASSISPGRARIGGTDAFIVRGGGLLNTWSGALDTNVIPPGEYQVRAYAMNGTFGRSGLLATARFTLTNTSSDLSGIRRMGEIHRLGFIHISRPGTIRRGEKILVSGTTNLPNDTVLLYVVAQQSNTTVFTVDPKIGETVRRGQLTRSGLMTPVPGDDGLSHWSFALDSTEFIPDRYDIIVTTNTVKTEDIGKEGTFGTAPLTVLDATSDLLTPTVPVTGPCQSILIDSLPGTLVNRRYSVTGTTSLQPGTALLFQVFPSAIEFSMTENNMTASGMGATGDLEVVRGTEDTNIWSADLDLSEFPPGEYLLNVSNDRIDSRTYETIYGDTFCSKRFIIRGGSS
jgi:hypothetical protein